MRQQKDDTIEHKKYVKDKLFSVDIQNLSHETYDPICNYNVSHLSNPAKVRSNYMLQVNHC